jgi:uncharacterized protein (DUF2062 family)
MSPIHWIRSKAGGVFHIKDTPHAIALGVAVGVFMGFIPLWGFKTLLALGITRLLRGSVVAAAIAVTLHDVTLPLSPLLLRWEYDIGYWLMSHPHELPAKLHLHQTSPGGWFHWSKLFTLGRPLLLGSVVIALPVTVAAYGGALFFARRVRHSPKPPPPESGAESP